MIEYDKITKEALYALAVELEQQIEAAEREKADQQDTQIMIAGLAKALTENADGLAVLEHGAANSANTS